MADGTTIEWAHAGLGRGATVNPIRAINRRTMKRGWFCEKVSDACTNCYAERLNVKPGASGGTGLPYKPGHRKDVSVFLHIPALEQMLRWRQPRGVFMGSMTDLFADFVTDDMLEVIFAHMLCAPRHRYLLLTKRPERAAAFLENWWKRVMARNQWIDHPAGPAKLSELVAMDDLPPTLPFVWIGTTIEDQRRADERRPHLQRIAQQGWLTFVSYEPALGPVEWSPFDFLAWLIAGGETGPKARPPHPDWFRFARAWATAAGVAFHFKQHGDWSPFYDRDLEDPDWRRCPQVDGQYGRGATRYVNLDGGCGFHGKRLVATRNVGKARAGRTLDGQTHDQFPEVF